MNGTNLLIALSHIDRKYIEESEQPLPIRKTKKIWLIAAVISLTLLLVGCAVAVYARIQMKVVQHHIPSVPTFAAAPEASVLETEPVKAPLINCYPQSLPAGYQLEEGSQRSHSDRRMEYRNASGKTIFFCISTYEPIDITLAPPAEKITMTVSGWEALLQVKENAAQALTWHNAAEGYYASLYTEDMAVDLQALAESVDFGEPLEVSTHYLGPDYTIELEQEKSTYVGWEPVYPQWVPEGYKVTFVSDPADGQQTIWYENASGEQILYTFYFRLGQWGRQFEGMGEPEEVTINGNPGYHLGNSLIWTEEAKGFGFELSGMPGVNLIAIAESVGLGPELEPTNADKTQKALAELGDYQIAQLPKGMVEDALTGMPLEDGGGWYSYVRRWYIDPKTNAQVYFEYESYVAGEDQQDVTLEEIAKARVPEGSPLDWCTIRGCTGVVSQNGEDAQIVWIMGTETKGVSFSLFSSDFTAQELLPMAESVQKQ